MIVSVAFGARKNPEVLPRLITFPLLLASFVWLLAPGPSLTPRGLAAFCINDVYPFLVVPAMILGGIIAVVTAKPR
jgi:hypothetical protein